MADQDQFKRSNNSVSNNPLLNEKRFEKIREMGFEGAMTVEGTVNKIGFLFVLAVAAAAFAGWQLLFQGNEAIAILALPAALIGFVLAMVVIFVPRSAPYLAPIYALSYGFALGVSTAMLEGQFPGIAVQACGLTLMTLAAMLTLYKTGIIRATPAFQRIMFVAISACFLMILVNLVMQFFGHPLWLGFGGAGSLAPQWVVLIFVGMTVISALCLILDFDRIEKGAAQGLPKMMEWYAAFGLMVTLFWVYINILRLLALFRKR